MKIILASGSPRRKWLLKQAGYSFEVLVPKVNEDSEYGESPRQLVKRLSHLKANEVAIRLKQRKCVVLAADTIVVTPDGKRVLGKPRNKKEALRMLSIISGKTHQVLTGYCLIVLDQKKLPKKISRVISTRVKIKKMNQKEILEYFKKGESMDKAGAYAAQGFGMAIVESVNGSYTNVVGLPLREVGDDLKRALR